MKGPQEPIRQQPPFPGKTLEIKTPSEYRSTSFYCTLQIRANTVFFTNRRFVAALHRVSLLAPVFQRYLLTSCLWHVAVILVVFPTLSLLYLLP